MAVPYPIGSNPAITCGSRVDVWSTDDLATSCVMMYTCYGQCSITGMGGGANGVFGPPRCSAYQRATSSSVTTITPPDHQNVDFAMSYSPCHLGEDLIHCWRKVSNCKKRLEKPTRGIYLE